MKEKLHPDNIPENTKITGITILQDNILFFKIILSLSKINLFFCLIFTQNFFLFSSKR